MIQIIELTPFRCIMTRPQIFSRLHYCTFFSFVFFLFSITHTKHLQLTVVKKKENT